MNITFPHSVRYLAVGLISGLISYFEIMYGHGHHQSLSFFVDGLHYASHAIVAVVSFVLFVSGITNPQRIRSVNLILLCFLMMGTIGYAIAVFAEKHVSVAETSPEKIVGMAIIAIVAGMVQLLVMGHEHDEVAPGRRITHDDVCFGLRWHIYADIMKSLLFIMLAAFSFIVTPESFHEMDKRVALGIALLYAVTMVPVLKRIAQKVAR